MMGLVVPEICRAYKKYSNKWDLVGFFFFSYGQMFGSFYNEVTAREGREGGRII